MPEGWIELHSIMDPRLKWLIRVDAISFIRKKSPADDVSVLLMSGGNIEPQETYTEIMTMLARYGGIA